MLLQEIILLNVINANSPTTPKLPLFKGRLTTTKHGGIARSRAARRKLTDVLCQPDKCPCRLLVNLDRSFSDSELGPMVCVRLSTPAYEFLLFRLKVDYGIFTNFVSETTKSLLSFSRMIAADGAQRMRLVCSEKTQKCHLDHCHRSMWVHYT
jgi:hypothetical protein